MKVVHVLFNLNVGGTETMLLDLMAHQVDCGADVILLLINRENDEGLISRVDNRVKIVQLNRSRGSKNPMWLFRFNYVLRRLHADAVHFHNVNAIGMLIPQQKTKYFFTHHTTGINNPYSRRLTRQFAISKAVKNDVLNRLGQESTIIYNGINVSSVICDELNDVEPKSDRFKILTVGRLEHTVKGQHIIIEAISKLMDKKVALDLIGDGSSLLYLKELASKFGVADRVNFMGLKSREYIYNNLCHYDLLVLPSINEGFGLALAEGMAAKIPVLTCNLPGPMEIIDGGRYGSYFNVADSDDCAHKLSEIISSYSTYKRIACGDAYDFVKDNFDIKVTAQRYLENYK